MRKRSWFLAALVVGALFALYFEPTRCVRGWLHGEAFFEGRPTSYWRGVVEHDLTSDPIVVILGTLPTWWDRLKDRIGYRPRAASSHKLIGNDEAEGVLNELTRDQDEKIAGFAADAQQWRRGQALGQYWVELIHKHNVKHTDSK